MFKGIMDEIASAITGRRVIQFETSADVPYTVIQYLESVGVLVRPGQAQRINEGNTTCNILVNAAQHTYAAGLIAGLPNCRLIDPPHGSVKPINPRTSWGKPARSAGIFAGICRTVAGGTGISRMTPPIKTKTTKRSKSK